MKIVVGENQNEHRFRWMHNGTVVYIDDNDQIHREDGPAIAWIDGFQSWYKHGKLHRENGPAIIYPNEHKCWFYNGMKIIDNNMVVCFFDENKYLKRIQEFIIDNRPDLIKQIPNLFPELKEKYRSELGLSEIEI